MYAHTMAGAYADFAEGKKGSLEPGKFAILLSGMTIPTRQNGRHHQADRGPDHDRREDRVPGLIRQRAEFFATRGRCM